MDAAFSAYNKYIAISWIMYWQIHSSALYFTCQTDFKCNETREMSQWLELDLSIAFTLSILNRQCVWINMCELPAWNTKVFMQKYFVFRQNHFNGQHLVKYFYVGLINWLTVVFFILKKKGVRGNLDSFSPAYNVFCSLLCSRKLRTDSSF